MFFFYLHTYKTCRLNAEWTVMQLCEKAAAEVSVPILRTSKRKRAGDRSGTMSAYEPRTVPAHGVLSRTLLVEVVTRRAWLTSCGWNYGMYRHGNRPDVTIWACVFHFCLSYFSDWKTWIDISGKSVNVFCFFFNIITFNSWRENSTSNQQKKKLNVKILTQRRIRFCLGEERDWAAAPGGLTFSILSLKGVWGLWDKDAGVAE